MSYQVRTGKPFFAGRSGPGWPMSADGRGKGVRLPGAFSLSEHLTQYMFMWENANLGTPFHLPKWTKPSVLLSCLHQNGKVDWQRPPRVVMDLIPDQTSKHWHKWRGLSSPFFFLTWNNFDKDWNRTHYRFIMSLVYYTTLFMPTILLAFLNEMNHPLYICSDIICISH